MKNITKRIRRLSSVDIISMVCLTLGALLIVIPFWNAIVISFQSKADYAMNPVAVIPGEFSLENYLFLLEDTGKLFTAYKWTIYLTVVGTFAGMLFTTMAAYGFSRSFPGKHVLFKLFLFTMYFGGGLIPTYLLLKDLHLLNNINATILLSLISVYNMIIMKNGFESVPMDLQEAAMIDGASDLEIFYKVMLPLQKPLIATFSLFTAVGYWNTWYWPMLTLTRPDVTVLQLYLRKIVEQLDAKMKEAASSAYMLEKSSFTEGVKMAAVFVVMLPIMIVYPFLQKYFTKGIMVGAVKM